MDPRSKKYFKENKARHRNKKGSANRAGYDEQNEITIQAPKENPAPTEKEDKAQSQSEKNTSTKEEETDEEK